MKTKILIFLWLVSILACQEVISQSKHKTNDLVKASMALHADSLLMQGISCSSICIYKDGEKYIGHYGEIEKGEKNKPTDESLYCIGSVTKTFLGLLVAQAVIDGELDLEMDIRKYLKEDYPNLEYEGKPIKIKDLVTHTSALPGNMPLEKAALFEQIDSSLMQRMNDVDANYSKEKFLKELHTITLDTLPGVAFSYSNAGANLTAHILENVYEKPFESLLEEKIFQKAGITNTHILLNEEQESKVIKGYGIGGVLAPMEHLSLWGADGRMYSNMPDMVKYIKLQLDENNPAILKSHEVLKSYSETNKTGYFWPIGYDETDGTYYEHHGGSFGAQTWLFIIPKHNMGIMIAVNNGDFDTGPKILTTVNRILDDIR